METSQVRCYVCIFVNDSKMKIIQLILCLLKLNQVPKHETSLVNFFPLTPKKTHRLIPTYKFTGHVGFEGKLVKFPTSPMQMTFSLFTFHIKKNKKFARDIFVLYCTIQKMNRGQHGNSLMLVMISTVHHSLWMRPCSYRLVRLLTLTPVHHNINTSR